ncbi:MAG: nucleoside hydrolase [Ancalomicrobiaceae bacterium]|nr:nucleoside hydrolase [Ancalomicrobiaceae bacterium]
MAKRKIIIDTDPGQDDSVAILTALGSPEELDVLAVVSVAGNVPLWRTTENALKITDLAGRPEIPVYAGCARPMRRDPVTAEHVHGTTGINGVDLPAPSRPAESQHGVDYLIDTLRANDAGEITLCVLGPITNIAMAMVKAPDISAKITEIVWMAGAYFEVGNITPTAEFNVYVDPEAADVVVKSGVKLTMVPLDVTHRALATHEWLDKFRALGNRCGAAVADMLNFSERFDLGKYGWVGAPLHDPCVIAYLLKPEIFVARHINVEIELNGTYSTGMTVADWWGVSKRPANVTYVRDVDADAFFGLLTERVGRLP